MNRLRLLGIWGLCLIGLIYVLTRMLYAIAFNPQRAWVLALSCDQNVNAAANGNPDETISSRAHRARQKGRDWGCILCGILDRIDKDHCLRSAGK